MKEAQFHPSEARVPIAQPGDKTGSAVLTLLNVEDFEPSRFRRTRIFRTAGFKVVEAASAREALAAAALRPLSIALIDVHLPDSSGIELCDTLKRLHPELPVLLISAMGISPEIRDAGFAAGAHSYIAEPVAAETLLQNVGNALNGNAVEALSDVWVVTDSHGAILEASSLGARLLSASQRGLRLRSLIVFFEHDRDAWRDAMARASRGERIVRSGHLRPKERRPIRVHVEIQKNADGVAPPLLWTFRTAES
jgi:DNA-binding response OmpR family regulator